MTCSACDAGLAEGSRFCHRCGARVEELREDAPRGAAVSGERRQVAVVFADITGFTALASSLDPEEVTNLVNRCFEVLVAPVEANGGYVDKFIGDCVMALFGAPTAHEDDDARAVRAALAMRDGVSRLAADLNRSLAVTVGVNAGLVIAGRIGSPSRRDYTVMGDAVNVAQRLQAAARPGQVLVGDGVARACADSFELRPLPPITVKGKTEPLGVSEALSERSRRARPRSRQPIVGREAELVQVAGVLDAAAAGSGRHLAFVAEAGAGKTRLVDELAGRARERGFAVLSAPCESHLRSIAYHPFRQIVAQAAGIRPQDDRAGALGKLFALAGEHARREELELLAPLLPGGREGDEPPRRTALAGALAALLWNLASTDPLVLVIEDLHAADGPTRDLLALLPGLLVGSSVVLAVTSRPDVPAPWKPPLGLLVQLEPLPASAAAELLAATLGAREVEEDIASAVLPRAEGNPLFVEELARSLLDAEVVRIDDGRARLTGTGSGPALPHTLQGLLVARIDRLPSRPREVLRRASVLGRSFRDELLPALAGHDALGELRPLVDGGYLVLEGEGHHRFFSPLLQEAAYASLLLAERRRLHGELAVALERLELPPAERVFLLAHHFARSERVDSAVHYLQLAGERAVLDGDFRGAIALCDTARQLVAEHPALVATGEAPFRKIRMRALKFLGSFPDAIAEGQALAAPDAPPTQRAWALFHLGEIAAWRGNHAEALALHRQAREVAAAAEDREMLAKLDGEIGWVLAELGQPREAAPHLDRALAAARERGDRVLEIAALNHRGIASLRDDDPGSAVLSFTAALALAEVERRRPLAWMVLCNLGLAFVAQGRDDRAVGLFERARDVARSIFDRRGESLCLFNWSAALLRLGKTVDARALASRSLATAEEVGWQQIVVLDRAVIAGADALEGDDASLAGLDESRRALDRLDLSADAADVLLLAGAVLRRLGRLEEARVAFEQARERGAGHGHCRVELAETALRAVARDTRALASG